jgi:hypothetical protein
MNKKNHDEITKTHMKIFKEQYDALDSAISDSIKQRMSENMFGYDDLQQFIDIAEGRESVISEYKSIIDKEIAKDLDEKILKSIEECENE